MIPIQTTNISPCINYTAFQLDVEAFVYSQQHRFRNTVLLKQQLDGLYDAMDGVEYNERLNEALNLLNVDAELAVPEYVLCVK